VVLVFPAWSKATDLCQRERTGTLLEQRLSFKANNLPVSAVIRTLLDRRIPISFLAANPDENVTLSFVLVDLKAVLDAIVTQAPAYRYEILGGRVLIYPRDAISEEKHPANIPKGRRLSVVIQFVDWLNQFPQFSDVVFAGYRGNINAPIFADLVEVKGVERIQDHLMQLSGSDEDVAILIVYDKAGRRFLELDTVWVPGPNSIKGCRNDP
jgi:hypothetical protein